MSALGLRTDALRRDDRRAAAWVVVALLVMGTPLGLLAVGVIESGSDKYDRWLKGALPQCGEQGVRSLNGYVLICRNGKLVTR